MLKAGAVLATLPLASEALADGTPPPAKLAGQTIALQAIVNGKLVEAEIETRTSLLDLLRERLALTGAKKGCDHASAAPAPCMSTVAASPPA